MILVLAIAANESRSADNKPAGPEFALGLPQEALSRIAAIDPGSIELGKKLFFDKRLSASGAVSCATCHRADQAFTETDRPTSQALNGGLLRRSAPTIFNVVLMETLFADGRSESLEDQALQPLVDPREMGNGSLDAVVLRLRNLADYTGRFEAVFRRPVDKTAIGAALAAFERTLVGAASPFDRWAYGGDKTAMDDAARRGFALFRGKAECSACHLVNDDHALFMDHRFHNTGVGSGGGIADADLGRAEATGRDWDRFKFKTPTLRNSAETAPYMHDGSLKTLADVVAFYNRGGTPHPTLDPLIHPLGLTKEEQTDLIAFLRSLTSPAVDHWRMNGR